MRGPWARDMLVAVTGAETCQTPLEVSDTIVEIGRLTARVGECEVTSPIGDRTYTGTDINVFRVKDGQAKEVWSYTEDPYTFDEIVGQ